MMEVMKEFSGCSALHLAAEFTRTATAASVGCRRDRPAGMWLLNHSQLHLLLQEFPHQRVGRGVCLVVWFMVSSSSVFSSLLVKVRQLHLEKGLIGTYSREQEQAASKSRKKGRKKRREGDCAGMSHHQPACRGQRQARSRLRSGGEYIKAAGEKRRETGRGRIDVDGLMAGNIGVTCLCCYFAFSLFPEEKFPLSASSSLILFFVLFPSRPLTFPVFSSSLSHQSLACLSFYSD